MDAFIVKELLTASVADTVVGPQEHDGIISDAFVFETLEDFTNLAVEINNRVEVSCPVLANHRMVGIVRGQFNVSGVNGVGYLRFAILSALQLYLGKERLTRCATCPVVRVIDGRVPDEIVIAFAEFSVFAVQILVVNGRFWSAVDGVIAILFVVLRQKLDVFGQINV